MVTQLDLFAVSYQRDEYTLSVPHIAAATTATDGVSVSGVSPSGCAVIHQPQCGPADAAADTTADIGLPPVLARASPLPEGSTPLVTVEGRLLSVPEPWRPEHRLAVLQHLLHEAVGAPIHWRRVATPRTPGLDAQRTGNLYRVGEGARDLIAHVHGGGQPDARQGRIALHMTRRIAEEMGRYQVAIQCVVTRVRRPGHLDVLVVAAIPWDLLAPIVEDRLAAGDGTRASLQCEIACDARGLTLRVPEADLDVSRHAGVGTLASALRGHPHEPWRSWTHADWMAVVSAVLTLRDGRRCSVAPLDARKRVSRAVLEELGIHGVHGHRLELPAASREALMYTDVLAAPVGPELRWHPEQPLLAVEIDAESDMTAVQELALRLRSAERLGLTIARGIVVADEGKRERFDERRRLLRDELADRIEFWSMIDVYEQYRAVRAEALRRLVREQRAAVRRAA